MSSNESCSNLVRESCQFRIPEEREVLFDVCDQNNVNLSVESEFVHGESSENTVPADESGFFHDFEGSSSNNNECLSPVSPIIRIPDVPAELKPVENTIFPSLEAVEKFYRAYVAEAGFDVRLATDKKDNNGNVVLKYLLCNREGLPNASVVDLLKKRKVRNSTCHRTGCMAKIRFKKYGETSWFLYNFVEGHNHPLISKDNRHLSKRSRELNYHEQQFIHNMSTVNVGATRAYKFYCTLKGGYDLVHGINQDFKNFQRDMNCFIGGEDAQMIVEKFKSRKQHVSNFSFEYRCTERHLDALFWADETSKLNFEQFGDVVSFDATFRTNKYRMVFVPFTGIDNHKHCVTFGAGLLCREDTNSYSWLLKAFLKCFGKQPSLVLTDQDPALKKAIEAVFPLSNHRLCMWLITQKLPQKVLPDLYKDVDFKKRFNSLVWNSRIETEDFEIGWKSMMDEYDLNENRWFVDMFELRDKWIPSYFKHIPLAGLMRTTSRSESENATFNRSTHFGSTLVYFMLSFESLMDKQRFNQNMNDHDNKAKFLKLRTHLDIEEHARKVYTMKIFRIVQKEILLSFMACFQFNSTVVDSVEVFSVKEKKYVLNKGKEAVDGEVDKDNDVEWDIPTTVSEFKVTVNKQEETALCDCLFFFEHFGLLCRHVFCILNNLNINKIPSKYIVKRWRKDLIPSEKLKKTVYEGEFSGSGDSSMNEIFSIDEHCVSVLRSDPEKLEEYLKIQKELMVKVDGSGSKVGSRDKSELMSQLLGVSKPSSIEIENPILAKNKGSGCHSRMKSGREIAMMESLKGQRRCGNCHQYASHNARTCTAERRNINDDS